MMVLYLVWMSGLVWVAGEMKHTELQRVVWRALAGLVAIDDRVGRGCEEARFISTMLRGTETRTRVGLSAV